MPSLKRDDVPLHYNIAGNGPPVLFIQGVGVIGTGWKPQVEQLAPNFQCLWFDNRGIGESVPCVGALTIEKMAADAQALMDAVGWNAAHVVGHSMGGVIAQRLALDAPQRVKSLALLCTFSHGAEAARLTPWVLWVNLRIRIGSRPMRRRAFLEMIFPPEYLAKVAVDELAARLTPFIGRDLAEQPPILLKQLRALGQSDYSGQLQELAAIPTTVVAAAQDPIAPPRYGRLLAQLIKGSRYVEIPAASHGVTLQDPPQINNLLREHFCAAENIAHP